MIDKNCAPGIARAMKEQLKRAQEAITAAALERRTVEMINNQVSIGTEELPTYEPNKRPRQENSVLPKRDYQTEAKPLTKNNKGKELVALCVEAFEDIQEQVANGATLNGAPIKAWAYRAAKIVDCVRNCHDNDQESFLLANAHFKLASFKHCAAGETHSASYEAS